jgi:hypothetical protein
MKFWQDKFYDLAATLKVLQTVGTNTAKENKSI